ncbi:membrane protein [Stenotrophomonas humi]|uniref:Membrane protein n=1 Tax=Stenotrophomonas humi TaxID=405444 RepID=A0A0R0C5B7_9GAMM|nr:DUF4381 domain-containing protein [Stenotrophomonas humi]KRG64677.1 membrane protein [Stenotrophomonas humi]
MIAAQLPLRDVHLPPAPGWWPLAPGWWLVIAVVILVVSAITTMYLIRQRRLQRWAQVFDQQLVASDSGPSRLAAASELLRRASRSVDAQAVLLHGEAWLRFLDGRKGDAFSKGEGRVLLEGGFRPQVDAEAVERACGLARTRFLELMAGKR